MSSLSRRAEAGPLGATPRARIRRRPKVLCPPPCACRPPSTSPCRDASRLLPSPLFSDFSRPPLYTDSSLYLLLIDMRYGSLSLRRSRSKKSERWVNTCVVYFFARAPPPHFPSAGFALSACVLCVQSTRHLTCSTRTRQAASTPMK